MLQLDQHGPITAIRMARSLLGRPVYWTAAYLVDGLLIDSGPAFPPFGVRTVSRC